MGEFELEPGSLSNGELNLFPVASISVGSVVAIVSITEYGSVILTGSLDIGCLKGGGVTGLISGASVMINLFTSMFLYGLSRKN